MIKKILFTLLIPFLFLSCEELFLDMNGVTCSLDKKTYTKGEDIVLTCKGSFPDENDEGDVGLQFWLYEIVNGVKSKKNTYIVIDSGNLEFDEKYVGSAFNAYIKKNARLTPFEEYVKIKINEVGEYELEVLVDVASVKRPRGTFKIYSLCFNVTE